MLNNCNHYICIQHSLIYDDLPIRNANHEPEDKPLLGT